MKRILFLLLVIGTLSYCGKADKFTFSLAEESDDFLLLPQSFCSDDEMSYDVICGRTVLKQPSLWKRILIRMYSVWYCQTRHMKNFISKNYEKLKNYTYSWYMYLYSYSNNIRK